MPSGYQADNRTWRDSISLPSYLPPQHEDLRRLCTVYQLWAHQMFPSGTFKDTMRKVEKLCHKKGVKVSRRLSVVVPFRRVVS